MTTVSSAMSQLSWAVGERLRELVWENATRGGPRGGRPILKVKTLGSEKAGSPFSCQAGFGAVRGGVHRSPVLNKKPGGGSPPAVGTGAASRPISQGTRAGSIVYKGTCWEWKRCQLSVLLGMAHQVSW